MFFLLLFFFILGSVFGSFINVVCDRVVAKESLLGRSYCDHCKKVLSPFDLVPILSFLVLLGKCRYCGRAISPQYPIVEAISGGLFALTFWVQASSGPIWLAPLLYGMFIAVIMLIVCVIDFKYSLIPTTFVFFASLISLFYNFFFLSSGQFVDFVFAAFGASLFFALIVLVTKGRGMGIGDVILAFLIGMVLGPTATLLALFLAFFIGAMFAVVLIILRRKKFGQTIPFGPFLVAGFFISFFWANQIISWYIRLY